MSKNGSYEISVRTATLVFEDMEGAEVKCRLDVPLEVYLSYAKLADAEDAEALEKAFRQFSKEILISWNLKLNGEAVPVKDGMLKIPPATANAILSAWTTQAMDVPLAKVTSS